MQQLMSTNENKLGYDRFLEIMIVNNDINTYNAMIITIIKHKK